MPQFRNFTPNPGQPNSLRSETPPFPEKNYVISGVTLDSVGAPLGNVTVRLFNSATNAFVQTTVSDGGGNYSFIVDKTQFWFEVSYLTNAPDLAGTTRRDLAGV